VSIRRGPLADEKTREEIAKEIEETGDIKYATMLRAALGEVTSKGVRPYGHTGVTLVGNIMGQPKPKRDQVHRLRVRIGDLLKLIHAALDAGEMRPEQDTEYNNWFGRFKWRGLDITFKTLGEDPDFFAKMSPEAVVRVAIHHNPGLEGEGIDRPRGEHHTVVLQKDDADIVHPDRTIRLVKGTGAHRDLVEPIVMKNGQKVEV
jgi:hypothetical protein